MPDTIAHPGPVSPERIVWRPCRAEQGKAILRAGVPLIEAMAGIGPAWVDLSGVRCEVLSFVQPAPAPGDGHAAWYSAITRLENAAIRTAGAHLGRKDGAPFAHVHGIWEGRMGHLLPAETVLAEDTEVDVIRLTGAAFEVAHDPETRFDIFRPVSTGEAQPNAAIAAIRPNERFIPALKTLQQEAGLEGPAMRGIGSLVQTRFADADPIKSYATEVLLTNADPGAPRAASVGFDGSFSEGGLDAANRVCVTFEVLLHEAI